MIIAEISGNHNGDLHRAKQLIKLAYEAGADAVKLQTYTADTITLNSNRPEFQINDGGLWHGRNLYELYKWAYTPWEWHAELFEYAHSLGILIFSSPFDETAVDFLEGLDCPIYKIASFEAMDLPLIKKAAETGKPLIISTGVIDDEQIHEALETVYSTVNRNVSLLLCVSQYPANPEDYNLLTLSNMAKRFKVPVGLSDHTLNNITAIASIALGATIVEKHFTLKRSDGGPDAGFSLEPDEFAVFVAECRLASKTLGTISYKNTDKNACYRSLYASQKIVKGEAFSKDNIKSIRPGLGLAPKELPNVLGRTAKCDIDFATPLSWDLID
jgi:N-acetylneuraminate synthase